MNPAAPARHQKLKYVCRIVGGGTPSKENLDFWSGNIPWVSPKDMGPFRISTTEDHITQEAVEASATSILPRGAVVVVVRSGILRHTLPVGVTAGEFAINQDMKALITRRGLLPEFLAYFIKGNEQRFLAEWGKSGTTVESLDQELMANSLVRIPLETEQTAVLVFLDRETAKIDDLIEKKQRIIELLDEKRAALISQAVTEGFVTSMPTGGEDLPGTAPCGWRPMRLKHLISYVTSGSRGWAEHYSTNGAAFLRVGNLSRSGIELLLDDVQRVAPPPGSEGSRTIVQQNDLLISITAWIGSVAVVPPGLGEAYVSQHLALCRPRGEVADSRWLAYALFAKDTQAQFQMLLNGGTKDGLGLDDVKNLRLAVPPLQEQKRLASELDRLSGSAAIARRQIVEAIELLREYRSALITAAVTGQLDIREHEKKLEALA